MTHQFTSSDRFTTEKNMFSLKKLNEDLFKAVSRKEMRKKRSEDLYRFTHC